jgi:hypothetical protein
MAGLYGVMIETATPVGFGSTPLLPTMASSTGDKENLKVYVIVMTPSVT